MCSAVKDEVGLLQTSTNIRPRRVLPLNLDAFGPAGTEAAQFPRKDTLQESDKIAILHIGKTGGSSVKDILKPSLNTSRAYFVDKNGHSASYREFHHCAEHPDHKLAYFVRAPVHRFVSSWVSRFRMGGKKMFAPWDFGEFEAFARFHSPDELGSALSSSHSATRMAARRAMHAIFHVKWSLSDYWGGLENYARCPNSTFFVGRTEHFDDDVLRLASALEEEGALLSKVSEVDHDHPSPDRYAGFKHLSERAIANLREWYKEDYEIIAHLIAAGHLPAGYLPEINRLDMEIEPYAPLHWLTFKTTWLVSCFICFLAFLICLCFSLPVLTSIKGRDVQSPAHLCGSLCQRASIVMLLMCLTCWLLASLNA